MKLLLTGARIIDPAQNIDSVSDILLEGGKIAKIAPDLLQSEISRDAKIIELAGMLLTPGLIDMHTHLREPGQDTKRPSLPEQKPL